MRNGSEAEVDEFKQRLADLKARGKSLKVPPSLAYTHAIAPCMHDLGPNHLAV